MANFLLVYHGGSMPETQEDQAKVMQAWTDWFAKLGPAVVDGGNPASQTRVLGADGSIGSSANPPSGYTILSANSIDDAVGLAKGCPVLADRSASIEVSELFPAM